METMDGSERQTVKMRPPFHSVFSEVFGHFQQMEIITFMPDMYEHVAHYHRATYIIHLDAYVHTAP